MNANRKKQLQDQHQRIGYRFRNAKWNFERALRHLSELEAELEDFEQTHHKPKKYGQNRTKRHIYDDLSKAQRQLAVLELIYVEYLERFQALETALGLQADAI